MFTWKMLVIALAPVPPTRPSAASMAVALMAETGSGPAGLITTSPACSSPNEACPGAPATIPPRAYCASGKPTVPSRSINSRTGVTAAVNASAAAAMRAHCASICVQSLLACDFLRGRIDCIGTGENTAERALQRVGENGSILRCLVGDHAEIGEQRPEFRETRQEQVEHFRIFDEPLGQIG